MLMSGLQLNLEHSFIISLEVESTDELCEFFLNEKVGLGEVINRALQMKHLPSTIGH